MKKSNRLLKIIKQVFNIKEVSYNQIDDYNIVFYNGPAKMDKMSLCEFNIITKTFDNIDNDYDQKKLDELNKKYGG
jgi:hypothetical protein